jgi:hypothetical protein
MAYKESQDYSSRLTTCRIFGSDSLLLSHLKMARPPQEAAMMMQKQVAIHKPLTAKSLCPQYWPLIPMVRLRRRLLHSEVASPSRGYSSGGLVITSNDATDGGTETDAVMDNENPELCWDQI